MIEDQALRIELSSRLGVSAERAWEHATNIAGVNRELWPLARMTHPPGRTSLAGETVVLGERLFRSWILAFGFLPIDYDDLTLIEYEPGRRFLERSPMLSVRVWQHERVVEPIAAHECVITDRIRFTPRWRALAPLQLRVYRLAFRLRHRNLCRLFAGTP